MAEASSYIQVDANPTSSFENYPNDVNRSPSSDSVWSSSTDDSIDLDMQVTVEEPEGAASCNDHRAPVRAVNEKRVFHSGDTHDTDCSENDLGGYGFSSFFKNCAIALSNEKLIQCSPKGKKVKMFLRSLEEMDNCKLVDVSMYLVNRINICITKANSKHKLPSAARGFMWSAFHKLRCSDETWKVWSTFATTHLPPEKCVESRLVLQLMMDRILKKLIQNKAEAKKSIGSETVRPLNSIECNAVRYMAGYVAITLLKRYRRPTKNSHIKTRNDFNVKILGKMKAEDLPGEVDTITDYTRLWGELMDRGGLYHINDQVYHLMETIELVLRKYFNIENVDTQQLGENLKKIALDAVLSSDRVLSLWEMITGAVPQKYESYSIDLLHAVAEQWINVRGHSFAQGWTAKFERKYSQGTRKTLQPQNK